MRDRERVKERQRREIERETVSEKCVYYLIIRKECV